MQQQLAVSGPVSEFRTSVGDGFVAPTRHNAKLEAVIANGKDREIFGSSGFANKSGVHCYRNAVLSILLNSRAFAAYCQQWHMRLEYSENRYVKYCHMLRLLHDIGRETNQVKKDRLVSKLWRRTCFPANQRHLQYRDQLPGNFWETRDLVDAADGQKDASEWLGWVLQTIEGQLASSRSPCGEHDAYRQMFETKFTRRVECKRCQHRVRNRKAAETTSVISLPINATPNVHYGQAWETWCQTRVTLQSLIDAYMTETLDDHYRCARCNQNRTATVQQRLMQQAPEILTLAINRTLSMNTKNTKAVVIPPTLNLDGGRLEPSQFGADSNLRYSLSGVVCHAGADARAGHYISYVRESQSDGTWRKINDGVVHPSHFRTSAFNDWTANKLAWREFQQRFTPYILLYQRDHSVGSLTPGRRLRNLNEGANTDIPPREYAIPFAVQSQIQSGQQSSDLGDDVIDGSDEEQDMCTQEGIAGEEEWPPAELNTTIRIDGCKIDYPTRHINSFQWTKDRDIEIEATLSVPRGKAKTVKAQSQQKRRFVELDVADTFIEKSTKRRNLRLVHADTNRKRRKQDWLSRWKNR